MNEIQQQVVIDPPRAIRVKTSTGWADLVIKGKDGAGVPAGGATGQALVKKTGGDYDTQWQAAGADLVYDGDYTSGPTYKDGEIVVYNGVAYMCTKPTTSPPSAWPGGITPAPQSFTISYVTTPPGSPTDGQMIVLVDSLTAPTYQWQFRFNAGSTSPYKWEFIGGSAFMVNPASTNSAVSSTTYAPITGAPSFVVPRSGAYDIEFGSFTYAVGTGAQMGGGHSLSGAGITASDPTAVSYTFTGISGQYIADAGATKVRLTLTSGGTLTIQGKAAYGGNVTVTYLWMAIVPVRIA